MSEYSPDMGLGEHVGELRRPILELVEKLGLIVVAEKMLPPEITDGLYDKNLDRLREVTNQEIERCNDTTS